MKRLAVLCFTLAMALASGNVVFAADQPDGSQQGALKINVLNVLIEEGKETNSLIYHLDQEVIPFGSGLSYLFEKEKYPPRTVQLFSKISEVPGVVSIRIEWRYQIRVVKGSAFAWRDVTPNVIQTITDVIQPTHVRVKILEKESLRAKTMKKRGK